MAPSLRDLIDFILAETALCGARGALPSDILGFITAFYQSHPSQRNHAVDRRFQEKVWSWLTRNPEVSVGRNKEGNHLSLAEAEHLASSASHQLESEDTKPAVDGPQSAHVFVSKERTWFAVTGHEPDDTKVLPTEFVLLSIIASAKSSGVSHPDLVRLSGQDKRSVPKRTDELHRKGYIQKRPIQIKGTRTSLCTLRKFLQEDVQATAASTTAEGPNTTDVIDFELFLGKLFDILREHKLISRNDLKNQLGFTDKWRWKILSRALRKLERIGVLKRVRALSQYAETKKVFHQCISFVREPSKSDFDMFNEHGSSMLERSERANHLEQDEDNDDPEADEEPASSGDMEMGNLIKQGDDVEEAGRMLPVWIPDRTVHNQVFDMIDRAGTSGITSQSILRICFGSFFRKPLEVTLNRLVECWQLSQPVHLRHLAIVRDTAMMQRMTHYVYYSAKNFQQLVDIGQATWEAVECVPRGGRASSAVHIPPVDAVPRLNSHGLPQFDSAKELLKSGNATLLDCITAAKPENYFHSGNDAIAVQLEDGTYMVGQGYDKYDNAQTSALRDTTYMRPRGRPKGTPNRPKREYWQMSDTPVDDRFQADGPMLKQPRRLTRDDRLAGMSEKEKLEALGLDETWTEYSALLIERPKPGVYVTPRGRRRPAGKRQGRPRISRLAVFKSPKLASLAWFRSEDGEQPTEGRSLCARASRANRADSPGASVMPIEPSVSERHSEFTLDQQELDEASRVPSSPGILKRRHSQEDSLDAEPALVEGTSEMTERRELDEPSRVPSSPRIVKRRHSQDASLDAEPASVECSTEMTDQRRIKRRRLGDTGEEDLQNTTACTVPVAKYRDGLDGVSLNGDIEGTLISQSKRKRQVDDQGPCVEEQEAINKGVANGSLATTETKGGHEAPDQDEIQEPSTKRRRHEPELPGGIPAEEEAERTVEGGPARPAGTPSNRDPNSAAFAHHTGPVDGGVGKPAEKIDGPNGDTNQPTPESQRPSVKRINAERGSVALQRRNVIMGIVNKAGGAFPWGTELWYPFTTAWKNMKYQGLPDLRTVKSATKHLVDAGRLRQMTFSGKDSKGVMVTKSIITKPELQPNDLVIKDLQKNMLAEPKLYFPPNTEFDPTLTNRGMGSKVPERRKPHVSLPVETGMTVKLHEKPEFVVRAEKQRGRRIQRQLLRSIESEASPSRQGRGGVTRLMKIHLPSSQAPASISRPRLAGQGPGKRAPKRHGTAVPADELPPVGFHRVRRLWQPVSSIMPYAMLLNPRQEFHASTGTFSTDAGVAALQARSAVQHRRPDSVPESQDQTLKRTVRKKRPALAESVGPDASRFSSGSGVILQWKLNNEGVFSEKRGGLRYINQTIQDHDPFQAAQIEGDIRFDHEEEREPVPAPEPMTTRRKARRRTSATAAQEAPPLRPILPRERPKHVELQDMPEDEGLKPELVTPKRKRPVTAVPQSRRLTKLNESVNADEFGAAPTTTPIHRQIARRRISLPPSLTQRIMTAIVVVRTLAGGLEGKATDWTLIPKGFPNHDPKSIQDRGKSLLSKNRLQLAKMQSDFQERFVEAYAKDEVPRIDYEDLEGYDWEAAIDWAQDHLEAPSSQKLPDLPATKEQFDSLFEVREEAPPPIDELYQTSHSVTIGRKQALQAGVPFAMPLSLGSEPRKAELSRLEIAKTWVRANITTPEETYQSTEARQALRIFGDSLIESALQSLVADRVISMGNRGRITPGRNYDVTDHFLWTLGRRRAIEHTQLRRAARFKTKILDPELQDRGSFDVNYHAEDGDILTLINLVAAGKITLKPRDPPSDKFGLTESGYVTRQMDKDKVRFTMEIHPVPESYVYGNPLQERMSTIPAPCPRRIAVTPSLSLPEKVPIWFDIHGQFNKLLWEQVVAAVVGCVATRPGISATGIANMIKPAMGAWEVQMLLEWMAEVGAAKHESQEEGEAQAGWRVEEWWWMVLGV